MRGKPFIFVACILMILMIIGIIGAMRFGLDGNSSAAILYSIFLWSVVLLELLVFLYI